jgi:hypothetical protein
MRPLADIPTLLPVIEPRRGVLLPGTLWLPRCELTFPQLATNDTVIRAGNNLIFLLRLLDYVD